MRHFALISDAALECLSSILVAMELLGCLPWCVGWLAMFLLDRALGGKRAIGLFPGVYRLWGKLRRSEAKKWEDKCAVRSFFAWGSGKGAADTVWRQIARAEGAMGVGIHVGAALKDFFKFYELVPHKDLEEKVLASELPKPISRLAVWAYGM